MFTVNYELEVWCPTSLEPSFELRLSLLLELLPWSKVPPPILLLMLYLLEWRPGAWSVDEGGLDILVFLEIFVG